MNDVEFQNDELPEEFQEWMREQDFYASEKMLWNFHRWMREETDLSSGTIVDYLKQVVKLMPELLENPEKAQEHDSSGVKKYQEFQDSDYNNN